MSFGDLQAAPAIMSREDRTGGRAHKTVLTIPVREYEIAQYGSASGSFLDKAAVPNPCALEAQAKTNPISA